MILDYNNLEANYNDIKLILTNLAQESKTYDDFEYKIKEDYMDGFTARLYKQVARQYGKEYISQIPSEERIAWTQYIDHLLDHLIFLNRGLQTKCRKNFDRQAFYQQYI